MQQQTGPERVLGEFSNRFGIRTGEQPRLYQAPGRINLIGEHTDYNGGLVLPATIDLHTWVAARPRDDRLLKVLDLSDGQLHTLDPGRLEPGEKGLPVEYFKGVPWALREAGLTLRGCDVAIGGNIPLGGGLSSSASLELALAFALLDCSGVEPDRRRLALLCQKAESGFVGARCGIMDQFVVALGERGRAMKLDCRSLEFELIRIPSNLKFLIVHSGVSHRVAKGSYNTRRDECGAALEKLRGAEPGLEFLAELSTDLLDASTALLDEIEYRRCRHVVTETRRVREAAQALERGDSGLLGSLLSQSHESLRDDFEVSCAELDRLVDTAMACEGVLGSRMMGGGFGGCTITLLEPGAAEDAAARIGREYAAFSGKEPWMHIAADSDAVNRIE